MISPTFFNIPVNDLVIFLTRSRFARFDDNSSLLCCLNDIFSAKIIIEDDLNNVQRHSWGIVLFETKKIFTRTSILTGLQITKCLAGTDWGRLPKQMLQLYRVLIRPRLEYWCMARHLRLCRVSWKFLVPLPPRLYRWSLGRCPRFARRAASCSLLCANVGIASRPYHHCWSDIQPYFDQRLLLMDLRNPLFLVRL